MEKVIDWFKGICNKHFCKFVMFDIKDFYPSITEILFKKAWTFAKAQRLLSDDDKAIIYHARKSLLFNDKQTLKMFIPANILIMNKIIRSLISMEKLIAQDLKTL